MVEILLHCLVSLVAFFIGFYIGYLSRKTIQDHTPLTLENIDRYLTKSEYPNFWIIEQGYVNYSEQGMLVLVFMQVTIPNPTVNDIEQCKYLLRRNCRV